MVRTINARGAADAKRPLVFSSIVDEAMSSQLGHANALFLDLFQVFIAPLETGVGGKTEAAATGGVAGALIRGIGG